MTDTTVPSVPDDSILEGVKKSVGIMSEDTHFDLDLIMHINGSFAVLEQLGAGPVGGFAITDNTATWTQLSTDIPLLGFIQQFVYFRVRLSFDPPATSFAISSTEKLIKELEYRIVSRAERNQT